MWLTPPQDCDARVALFQPQDGALRPGSLFHASARSWMSGQVTQVGSEYALALQVVRPPGNNWIDPWDLDHCWHIFHREVPYRCILKGDRAIVSAPMSTMTNPWSQAGRLKYTARTWSAENALYPFVIPAGESDNADTLAFRWRIQQHVYRSRWVHQSALPDALSQRGEQLEARMVIGHS